MPSRPVLQTEHEPAVDRAVARHGADIVAILQAVQAERGHLTPDAIGTVASVLGIPAERAFGIASFYSMFSIRPRSKNVIRVCDSPVCQWNTGGQVRTAFDAASGSEWTIERTSCLGLCDRAPSALIGSQPCGPLTVARVPEALAGWRGVSDDYSDPLAGEVRVTMARIGKLDPDSIDSARGAGAYQSLRLALQNAPSDVVKLVEDAGVQGRGGAGFPVGHKWRLVAQAASPQKFVVCNFDESEPGTFKDRVLVDGDPHLLLEGMALCAYAVGATEGYIYVRGEYEWITQRLERAIFQAEQQNCLGTNILSSGLTCKLHVHRGAGAYICGEETALLESLEGRRGEPRARPPFPTAHGYLGMPTVVNNVESLCTIPPLVEHSAAWYRSLGSTGRPGVKLFSVCGHVQRPCVFEVPYGITLRQIIEQFGGGMKPGSQFKLALTGGAAGTMVPASQLDVPIQTSASPYEPSVGSGAMLILDSSVSAPALLLGLLHFFEVESCGKCTPCREGTREARILVARMASGQANAADVVMLSDLSRMLGTASLCGLGQSAALPIESALEHFGHEFTRNAC